MRYPARLFLLLTEDIDLVTLIAGQCLWDEFTKKWVETWRQQGLTSLPARADLLAILTVVLSDNAVVHLEAIARSPVGSGESARLQGLEVQGNASAA